MCLTTYFKHFVFIELFDLNSNLNNLFESSSMKASLVDSSVSFLVDLIMKFCILPISTKILKFSLSGLILINSQPSFFFYYFLSFYCIVNISVIMPLFMNLYF